MTIMMKIEKDNEKLKMTNWKSEIWYFLTNVWRKRWKKLVKAFSCVKVINLKYFYEHTSKVLRNEISGKKWLNLHEQIFVSSTKAVVNFLLSNFSNSHKSLMSHVLVKELRGHKNILWMLKTIVKKLQKNHHEHDK